MVRDLQYHCADVMLFSNFGMYKLFPHPQLGDQITFVPVLGGLRACGSLLRQWLRACGAGVGRCRLVGVGSGESVGNVRGSARDGGRWATRRAVEEGTGSTLLSIRNVIT